MFFLPFLFFILIFYFVSLGLLFFIIQIGLIKFTFERIGVSPDFMFSLLFLTLFGSMINIPIKRISTEIESPGQIVNFFGWRFRVPGTRFPAQTVIAINLGGAVIPSLLSLYLLLRWPQLMLENIVAIVIISALVYKMARPIKGVGIATPALFPPLVAAATALIIQIPFHPGTAPIIAYVSGTLGTLIGADLMNTKKIAQLQAPVASIGGAGTFDGIFLTGVIAVLLTSF